MDIEKYVFLQSSCGILTFFSSTRFLYHLATSKSFHKRKKPYKY